VPLSRSGLALARAGWDRSCFCRSTVLRSLLTLDPQALYRLRNCRFRGRHSTMDQIICGTRYLCVQGTQLHHQLFWDAPSRSNVQGLNNPGVQKKYAAAFWTLHKALKKAQHQDIH